MYLYLVRHGQSEGNAARTFHGRTDYPLTELGREQARQSGEKLSGVSFTRCCASTLSRAWETARICLGDRAVEIEPCPELREQDIGEMEGLTWQEMEERFPHLLHPYIEDWWSVTPPGGESPEVLSRRVNRCVEEIIARGEDTLIVGHAIAMSMILDELGLMGRDKLLKPEGFFSQGTYTAIRVENGVAELVCFNR
ncbi:MAG: histidine phosphatase family protein [Oscillospiraceae bacterium]|nr:histidine phosphatase family protein [Oscillospiraceae bacterium]